MTVDGGGGYNPNVPLTRDEQIEHGILKLAVKDGVTGSRSIIDTMVTRGWPEDDVVRIMVDCVEKGYFMLEGPTPSWRKEFLS